MRESNLFSLMPIHLLYSDNIYTSFLNKNIRVKNELIVQGIQNKVITMQRKSS